jgi:hypothetical protein
VVAVSFDCYVREQNNPTLVYDEND